MGEGGFWDDNEAAQRVVSELKGLKTVVSPMNDLTDSVGDLEVLFEMAEEDSAVQEEVEEEPNSRSSFSWLSPNGLSPPSFDMLSSTSLC